MALSFLFMACTFISFSHVRNSNEAWIHDLMEDLKVPIEEADLEVEAWMESPGHLNPDVYVEIERWMTRPFHPQR